MRISEICSLLKQELYENNYEYGFFFKDKKYKPDINNGFDVEYSNLLKTIYRIQDPKDTMREKIGTCIDVVMVMKTILEPLNVSNKIWLIRHRTKKNQHTILTFEAEGKTIYLELTPQSNKPWYGKEIIYNDERAFLNQFHLDNYDIVDVTNEIAFGKSPDCLLQCLGG